MHLQQMSITGLAEQLHNKKTRERYYDPNDPNNPNYNPGAGAAAGAAVGVASGVLAVVLIIGLAIWIWALVVTLKFWKVLPEWAKVIGVLGLLPVVPLGPVVTLIVVYIAKSSKK